MGFGCLGEDFGVGSNARLVLGVNSFISLALRWLKIKLSPLELISLVDYTVRIDTGSTVSLIHEGLLPIGRLLRSRDRGWPCRAGKPCA